MKPGDMGPLSVILAILPSPKDNVIGVGSETAVVDALRSGQLCGARASILIGRVERIDLTIQHSELLRFKSRREQYSVATRLGTAGLAHSPINPLISAKVKIGQMPGPWPKNCTSVFN